MSDDPIAGRKFVPGFASFAAPGTFTLSFTAVADDDTDTDTLLRRRHRPRQ